jgi:hypothetical protein
LIQSSKRTVKERKFCNKVIKLVRDVEGKKPENLKDAWRWIRGLLHDFVGLKKLLGDQQRIIKKVELIF